MHNEHSVSPLPKITIPIIHFLAIIAAAWILLGDGDYRISSWLRLNPQRGVMECRTLLFGAALLYFLRLLLTLFVFFKRQVHWSEAMALGSWIAMLQLLYAFFGGRQTSPLNAVAALGICFYLSGSFINTASEFRRYLWKRQPQHAG